MKLYSFAETGRVESGTVMFLTAEQASARMRFLTEVEKGSKKSDGRAGYVGSRSAEFMAGEEIGLVEDPHPSLAVAFEKPETTARLDTEAVTEAKLSKSALTKAQKQRVDDAEADAAEANAQRVAALDELDKLKAKLTEIADVVAAADFAWEQAGEDGAKRAEAEELQNKAGDIVDGFIAQFRTPSEGEPQPEGEDSGEGAA